MRRLLLLFLCILLLTPAVCAAQSQVSALDGELSVQADGTCQVTFTALVSFSGSEKALVFPLGSGADDVSASGASYEVEKINGVSCVVFSNGSGFSGTHTFTCSYTLPGTITETENGQAFHLKLLEKGWEYPIEDLELQIEFPVEVPGLPAWRSAYYEDSVDNYLSVTREGNLLSARSVVPLKDNETLEFTLDFPAGSFVLRNQQGGSTTFNRIAFFVLAALAVLYWALFLRGKLLLPKTHRTAGMEATAGEIPCQLYGELPDIPALLASWGNLGYVTIYRNRRGRVILCKRMEMGNERKPSERKLFYALFRTGSTCDLLGQRFRTVSRPACFSLRGGWVRRIFRPKTGNPLILRGLGLLASVFVCILTFDLWLPAKLWRWFLLPLLVLLTVAMCASVQIAVLSLFRRLRVPCLAAGSFCAVLLIVFSACAGCLGIMLLNLLLQSLCALATLFGGQRTPFGEEQARQILGLRNYLCKGDREELRRLCHRDSQFFYRMLPFAELMGVGSAFVRHFPDWRPEPCPWLTDARKTPATARDFYKLYCEIFFAVRSAHRGTLSLPKKPAATAHRRR